MKNIIFIYNPNAGDATFRFLIDRFIEIFSEKQWEIRIFRSRERGDMAAYIASCDLSRTEAVFVAGGTGSVSEVVGALLTRGKDLPVGILPVGTQNELAKKLGFTEDLEENLKALYAMEETRVDVGRAGSRYFVDSLSVGTLAARVSVSDEARTTFGQAAYVIKGLASLRQIKKVKLSIEADETRYTGYFSVVALANTGLWSRSIKSTGEFTLIAAHQPFLYDKHLFEKYGENAGALAGENASKLSGETIGKNAEKTAGKFSGKIEKGVLRLRGNSFRIYCAEESSEVQGEADGEPGLALPLEIEIQKAAIRFFYNPYAKAEKKKIQIGRQRNKSKKA